ncbi:hypothetical protein HU200_003375 [Digitaria exilis]|uniref:Protein kinase domain-containing protein n=1 Tax=Digitaria exilis TaxID=1010633 RepID=A0A835KYH1_9POAL|nr:hypothetical protein HU200_003375 [Digitaria exilis]
MRLLLPLLAVATATLLVTAAAAATCQRRCGGLEIPYPFGIGRGCYLNKGDDRSFEVICSSNGTATAAADAFELIGIDVRRGRLRVRSPVSSWCYGGGGRQQDIRSPLYNSTAAAFRVSAAENVLAAVGCDVLAFIVAREGGVEDRHVVGVGVVVLVVAMACAYAVHEKKRLAAIKTRYFTQHGGRLLFEMMKSGQEQGRLSFTLFTKEELEDATNKFDERYVLGKGGNGIVYQGNLKDGRVVAIKRCRVADDERQRRELGKEMLILSQVNHRSIVKLYGCCLEVEVPMLVYQFIPNGTLYELLHRDHYGGAPPPLAVRLKVAHEAAEALAYHLHSMASPPAIIHGDVKSANILLDEGVRLRRGGAGAGGRGPPRDAGPGDVRVPGPGVHADVPPDGQERRVQLRRRAPGAAHEEEGAGYRSAGGGEVPRRAFPLGDEGRRARQDGGRVDQG